MHVFYIDNLNYWRDANMKRFLILIFTIVIVFQLLIGCSTSMVTVNKVTPNNALEFKEIYSHIIGFSTKNNNFKPIDQDTILFMTNEAFQEFKDEYFSAEAIQIKSPDTKKAVLYLQIPSLTTSTVINYTVNSININNDTLTVNLKKSAVTAIDCNNDVNCTWEWVIFLEVDKTNLKDNISIIVKKSDK